MTQTAIQASFNSGEWSPKLYSRVDMVKYRSGAALLENYFVDYRGGASTRPGTKYVAQCYSSGASVRLIPFQASFDVGYILEFGDGYIRFFFQGAPIVESPTTITAAGGGPPTVFTDNAHGYGNNQWIFVENKYYVVQGATANTFTLTDLFGNPITTNPFTLPAAASRVYTIASPYAAADLRGIKFAQNVNQLILCHPNYPPYVLTLITATNWTMNPITFGPTISTPINLIVTRSNVISGNDAIAYIVTAVDGNGIESAPSVPLNVVNCDLANVTNPWTITLGWTAIPGASSYNIYKSNTSTAGPITNGAQYGFIGNSTDAVFQDTFIAPDFSQVPPLVRNPFSGSSLISISLSSPGAYTTVPTVTIAAPPAGGVQATANCVLTSTAVAVAAGGAGYALNDIINTSSNGGIRAVVTALAGTSVSGITLLNAGAWAAGAVPANPVGTFAEVGSGVGCTLNVTWGIAAVTIGNPGSGYTSPPAVTFAPASATATAVLTPASNGNPSVPGFFQQRLVLAAPALSPQTFYMSQPGAYFNFNISSITQPTDSISGTLVSGQLNTIKSMVGQASGLLMFTDRNSWIINGGSGQGSAISPTAIVANTQSYNGLSDVPPIIANFDVLYVQAKGSIIRDSAYNIYSNVYTGTDISAISSHLFYGYTVDEWAWAEEPFKVVWAVRSDGAMLTLTFLKEQEFVGWAHSVTAGQFLSVATIVEQTATAGQVDAIYTVVRRHINNQDVQYIERIAERTYPGGVADAWTVDCGIRYIGAPTASFSGAEFLGGQTVTGLADGVPITPFVMPFSGNFTLPQSASKVLIGIGFTCDLQTLPIELGDPTIQSKVKKINQVDVMVADTLGLSIGGDFDHLVPMKDLIRGQVSGMLTGQPSQIVTDLVNGHALTILNPTYTVPGQYCIRQSLPYPATILGVVPNITVGDGGQRER